MQTGFLSVASPYLLPQNLSDPLEIPICQEKNRLDALALRRLHENPAAFD
jgi:hypothetical protein